MRRRPRLESKKGGADGLTQPPFYHEAEIKSQMPYHYTTGDTPHRLASAAPVNRFEFYRYRFQFTAAAPIHFPAGKSANVVRGAFGLLLRDTAAPSDYARLFEPRTPPAGGAPSGMADWPRPFVFRTAHLDGVTIPPGAGFYFDAHVFDTHQPASTLAQFRTALAELARSGIGPRRSGAFLQGIEQLLTADAGLPARPWFKSHLRSGTLHGIRCQDAAWRSRSR